MVCFILLAASCQMVDDSWSDKSSLQTKARRKVEDKKVWTVKRNSMGSTSKAEVGGPFHLPSIGSNGIHFGCSVTLSLFPVTWFKDWIVSGPIDHGSSFLASQNAGPSIIWNRQPENLPLLCRSDAVGSKVVVHWFLNSPHLPKNADV